MLTVTQLARRCGLSRTTLLYYECVGLLQASHRGANNYRRYSEKDLARLQRICTYRDAGLKLEDIAELLNDGTRANAAAEVLNRRLAEINGEIEVLRRHQHAIMALLKHKSLRSPQALSKRKWVEIMRSSGFGEPEMHRWHAQFETMAPAEHRQFLQFLNIAPKEIGRIREWSRKDTHRESAS